MNIQEKVRELRIKSKMTQEHLGNLVGVDRIVINKIESGRVNPSEKLFVRILESMGYTLMKKIVKINSDKA